MADFAKEALFERIDEQWEDFGFPKVELDNIDSDSTDFPTKGSKKVRNRATRRKATAKKKARNKRLANTKGKNSLYLAKRPENAGTKCVLSNRWSEHNKTFHKEWYPDTNKGIEQKKVSARELKKYFNSVTNDEAKEKEFIKKYYEGTCEVSFKELVEEFFRLETEGIRVKNQFGKYKKGKLLETFSYKREEDYDSHADYTHYYNYLKEIVARQRDKKKAIQPLTDIMEYFREYRDVDLRVCYIYIPDNFNLFFMDKELYTQIHEDNYMFFAMDRREKEMIPLFSLGLREIRDINWLMSDLQYEYEEAAIKANWSII